MKKRTMEPMVRVVVLLAVLGVVGCHAKTESASTPDEARSSDAVGQTSLDARPEAPSPRDTAAPSGLDQHPDTVAADVPSATGEVAPSLEPMGSAQPTAVMPKSAVVPKSIQVDAAPSLPQATLDTAAPTTTSQTATRRTASAPVDVIPLASPDAMSAKAEEAAAAAPSPTLVAPVAPTGDYTLVKVFYGTDREAITDTVRHPLGKIPWEWLTAGAACLTVLLLLVRLFAKRSVVLSLTLGASLVATIVLGACMYQIPRNTKPDTADTSLRYGGGRGNELQMGVCEVSIPKTHKVGQLESPSILSLEFNEDPEKHVVSMGVQRREPDAFFDELNARINEDKAKEAFVFVHGYNVTFEKAARRTAQLAHDLRFEGAPIFYSWPSVANPLQYTIDENNVVWTVPQLREFLLGIAQKTEARRVHLIAHSMGNRALTAALARLSMEVKQEELPLFHEVLLTAPDIDADVFRRDIAPAIVKTAQRVTLYASSNDNALIASKKVHGYPRAGESGASIVVLAGIDTIDVSGVDTSLLGHSYYGSSDSVLSDMAQLLHEYKPPDLRERLKAVPLGTLRYWQYLAGKIGIGSEADHSR